MCKEYENGHYTSILSRAEISTANRRELEWQMAQMRINRALHNPTPPSADFNFQEGDQALILREKIVVNSIGERMGPITVLE